MMVEALEDFAASLPNFSFVTCVADLQTGNPRQVMSPSTTLEVIRCAESLDPAPGQRAGQ